MGTLHDKLKYLAEAVNDIQLAINEKKVKVDSKVPLGDYGDKIRAIQTGNLWADYVTIEAFPSFTVDDLVAKDVKDITDDVILGTVDGFNSQDCISIEVANVPFTEKDLIAKDIEDVTIARKIKLWKVVHEADQWDARGKNLNISTFMNTE